MPTPSPDVAEMNARLAAIVAASSDAIISYGADATILTWNPAAERLLGYTAEEVIGQPMSIIVPPERAREHAEFFTRLRAGDAITDLETVRLRKDGSRILVRVNLAPIRGADGAVTSVSATVCDLSERKLAEERFRALLESAPDPILGVNREGRIVFANAQTEKVFGYLRAELLGQSVELLVPERFRVQHHRQWARYQHAPTARAMGGDFDLWARRRDGSEVPVEIGLSSMADADGPVTVAIVRDITARKRVHEDLRERERRFRAIFNATFQFIGLMTPDGTILEANQSALDLAGVAAEAVIGTPFWETPWWTHSPELQARLKEAVHSAAQGEFVRFEASHRRADGSLAAVDFSLKPVRDEMGQVILLVPEGRDITDRRRAELEREELLAVAQAARASAEASLRIRAEAERMKDDLTKMVVHDLKNPVIGITMMIRAALRRRDDLPASQRNTLLQIDRTCQEMMRLIQNLLEISKMEEGQMPVAREEVVVAEILDDVRLEYAPVAEQTGKSLRVAVTSELPAVIADYALLKRVLVNLVINALRHSGSHEVRVESASIPDNGEVAIRVIDYGHGIPEEEQTRVFEKFATVRRGPESNPSTDTGLGLPFCKMAVERMGGRIALTSAAGTSTVFAVALPIHSRTASDASLRSAKTR